MNAQPGGFYHPSVVVGDARRHGLAILGPDLARSAYDCILELTPDSSRSQQRQGVRLGLRYVRGLAEASGTALMVERDAGGPFRDLADLCRWAHECLASQAVAALVAAGACDGWGIPRRQLLWVLPAAWAGATGLALPPGPVVLPSETADERRAGEGWATGVPLGDHPVAAHRITLTARHPAPGGARRRAGRGDGDGGGAARHPAAPAHRRAEDETGLGNLVLSPAVDAQHRAALHAAPLVVATGRVRRRAGVVNVQVATVMPGGGILGRRR